MEFYLDFEGTQFNSRIISIGCVAQNGNTFNTLVHTNERVTHFITDLTGITKEQVAGAPSPDEAFLSFYHFVQENDDNKKPRYYCYGKNDANFIKNTCKDMKDLIALAFAESILKAYTNYAVEVRHFFLSKNDLGLRKVYSLINKKELEPQHDALEDAIMLWEVKNNLSKCCTPEDRVLLNVEPVVKKEKKVPTNRKAPEKFVAWNGDKWKVDTGATRENCAVYCSTGRHKKYFDSMETAVLWAIKYFIPNASPKRNKDLGRAENQIRKAVANNKSLYGMEWVIK